MNWWQFSLSIIFFGFFLWLAGLPLLGLEDVGAQVTPPSSYEVPNPLGTTDFSELVNRIATWLFNIGLAVSTVIFLWGGFQFLVSAGNEEKIKSAKNTMFWGAVGLGICLIGTGFTYLIKELLGMS